MWLISSTLYHLEQVTETRVGFLPQKDVRSGGGGGVIGEVFSQLIQSSQDYYNEDDL